MLLPVVAQDTLTWSHSFAIPNPDDGEPSNAPERRSRAFSNGQSLVAAGRLVPLGIRKMRTLRFTTKTFSVEQNEHPDVYGNQFREWLRKQLIEKGYAVQTETGTDSGWGYFFAIPREDWKLRIGTSHEYDNDIDEKIAKGMFDSVIWHIWLLPDSSIWQRFTRRNEMRAFQEKVYSSLEEILRAPEINRLNDYT
jgi:hypothetical protein